MSTLKTNNVQVGQSATATNNFTLYQPSTPDGTVRLGVGNTGATTADVITANSSGNVGIGTSSPQSKLHVVGDVFVGNNSNVQWSAYSAGTSGVILAGDSTNNRLDVYTTGTLRARFDSSGNLLVGKTTNATASLGWSLASDRGNAKFSAGNYMIFNRDDNDILINFRRSDASVGTITVTTTATAYNTSSDYRLKHDIAPMTGALARVAALKPVTYKWNANDSDGEGFIAHELAEVVPDAVTGEKDAVDEEGKPIYQGIDTSFLVATLTAAIQELKAEVDALKAQLGTQP